MKKIYESHYYDFAHDGEANSLVFQWKSETKTIDDNGFKEALSNFAGYAFELATPNMVVDVRNFRPEGDAPSKEAMGPWRTRVAVPRYNRAGVKKFAYIRNIEGGGPPVGGPNKYESEEFETAVFDSEEKLRAWLKA